MKVTYFCFWGRRRGRRRCTEMPLYCVVKIYRIRGQRVLCGANTSGWTARNLLLYIDLRYFYRVRCACLVPMTHACISVQRWWESSLQTALCPHQTRRLARHQPQTIAETSDLCIRSFFATSETFPLFAYFFIYLFSYKSKAFVTSTFPHRGTWNSLFTSTIIRWRSSQHNNYKITRLE